MRWDILQFMADRIGVFGGTFDPPHLGHLILAAEAMWQLDLTGMLWVLTALPPHKGGKVAAPLQDRLAMLELALDGEPAYSISKVDMERPGPHYTAESLGILRNHLPEARLVLLLGGDSLSDLPRWHKPTDVIARCDEIGVMRRPGAEVDLSRLETVLPGLMEKLRFVEAPLLEISSREIRERAGNRRPFKYYLPGAVHDYILDRGLYLEQSAGQQA